MNLRKSFLNILFWSVVSAAFIGPGTITTAAKSGALFGTDLLWALLFATFACFILQEAAAKLTILSGKNLGQVISESLSGSISGKFFIALIALAIYIGAIAYEAGNLIGAREGLKLIFPGNSLVFIIIIGMLSGFILLIPSLKIIARIMGVLVMILGISFLTAAIRVAPDVSDILSGFFKLRIPESKEAPLLILGLIGTTIVPYNLFLGSGISGGSIKIGEMRQGLFISILLGGVFSMAVLLVGIAVSDNFSFANLANSLNSEGFAFGKVLLGTGLFAAGFTSGITAPLAAAITLKSLFGEKDSKKWKNNGSYFRLSWLIVLITGIIFAVLKIEAIRTIIIAQALNGLILPFISFFLVWLINSPVITGKRNSVSNNIFLAITLIISLTIGIKNLLLAFEKAFSISIIKFEGAYAVLAIFSFIFTMSFMYFVVRKNRNAEI